MFVRLTGVAATVVAAFLLLNQVPVRGQQTPVQIPDAVLTAAGQGQLVRIIVGVRVDSYRPEGDLDGPAAAAQRADVTNRVDQVVGRLNAVVQRPVRRFDTIPFFATVCRPQLAAPASDRSGRHQHRRGRGVTSESCAERAADRRPDRLGRRLYRSRMGVAVLDTGVEKTHPFLTGKVVSEACYSNAGGMGGVVTTCPDGTNASTATGSGVNCAAVINGCNHGTHVAGIAAGTNATFSGVARGASLIAIQVFSRFNSSSTCAPRPGAVRALLHLGSDRRAAACLRTPHDLQHRLREHEPGRRPVFHPVLLRYRQCIDQGGDRHLAIGQHRDGDRQRK